MASQSDNVEIAKLESRVDALERQLKTFNWIGGIAFGLGAFACFFTFFYGVANAFSSIMRDGFGH